MDSGLVGAVVGLENERDRRFETPRTLGMYLTELQSLPGLVGLWNMGSVQRSTGNAYDLSEQGRTLTYNGNPTFNIHNGIVPYIDLDGTGDFLSRADETDLDILGTETIYASAQRGLTIGGWFWWDAINTGTPNQQQQFIGKWDDTGANRSYAILNDPAGGSAVIRFYISLDGGAVNVSSATVSVGLATAAWHFFVGRFIPATEVALYADGTFGKNTTTIQASIFNSAATFEIGRYQRVPNLIDGRAALCFLCANALLDARVDQLWRWGRGLFGI